MKYFVRSVKTFVHFALLFAIILALLVGIGAAPADISEMFVGGYDSLWQIALILAVISAVYPKVSFAEQEIPVRRSVVRNSGEICSLMSEFGYEKEKSDDLHLTFRKKSAMARIARKFEDRITVTDSDGGLIVEGMRKDIVRIASRMEYRFREE